MRLQSDGRHGALVAVFILLITSVHGVRAFGDDGVRPTPRGILVGPMVVSDTWPECTDVTTWMRDIMRLEGVEGASDTEQAKALFQWLRLFSRIAVGGMIQAIEGDYGSEQPVLDVHKNLFVYGWGHCDTHSRIAEASWLRYKRSDGTAQRVITQHENGGYHTMYRLFLDGQWGAFDARYGYYLIANDDPNARILDWADVGVDDNILRNKKYVHRSKPFFEFFGREWDRALYVQPTFYESERAWRADGAPIECAFADSHYSPDARFHDMSFRMPRGMTITRYWDNRKNAYYVPKREVMEKFLPSGRFYRVTDAMFDRNWVRHDPNYQHCEPYLVTVPSDQGYPEVMHGGKTIGQACGEIEYEPPWDTLDDAESAGLVTDMVLSKESPYLRPAESSGDGYAIVDFHCPYVLVDGTLSGKWEAGEEDQPSIQIRTLHPKRLHASVTDRWTEWQTLQTGPGDFQVNLGRSRLNSSDVSVHGKYRFQIKLALEPNSARSHPVGLGDLKVNLVFENALMSIPRIHSGANTIQFKLNDASTIQHPIEVRYRYMTSRGLKSHSKVLRREDFVSNRAQYHLDAEDLVRCDSLQITY